MLFPTLDAGLEARDSLFPATMRGWLPSYYFWIFPATGRTARTSSRC
jgi:hypothetical protein